jgi:hypothetical protein
MNYELPKALAFGSKMKYELSKSLDPFGLVYKKSKATSFKGNKINIISSYKKECTAKRDLY